MMITRLRAEPAGDARPGAGGARGGRVTTRDLLVLARQMKMLLEAGSAVVPALEAIERQTQRPALKEVVRSLRVAVENGGSLVDAMRAQPRVFRPVFCSMVAAGEATASLPRAFDRLGELTTRQLQARGAVLSAMTYPCVLASMCVVVVGVLILFVVPRFRMMFESLNAPLPFSTRIMFALSNELTGRWPLYLAALGALVAGAVTLWRSVATRQWIDVMLLSTPGLGPLLARLEFARIVRIWAAMLRSNVPLLEAIEQSRGAAANLTFKRLLTRISEQVSSGGRLGQALSDSGLVDPVIAAAIRTGEENGRLAEATEFVSEWLDDDNRQLITTLTRIAEPAMLAIMGMLVGIVAMALFLPMFDLAGAG
jgi:type II secretory pathway component PulF